jgi:S1-C subfamily serine protease
MNNMPNILHKTQLVKICVFIFIFTFIPIKKSLANEIDDKEWDKVRMIGLEPGVRYNVASGTGFFINENTIITSEHVVSKCVNIAIRGSKIKPSTATLISADEYEDLAILKTDSRPLRVPFFRSNISELKYGERIYSIGYPLKRGETGLYISMPADVIRYFKNEGREYHEIEFTDSVDHGNSGGPILDGNYNIIGVVKAKVTYKNPENNRKTIVGQGVGLDGIFSFLDKYNVSYKKQNSYDVVISFRPDLDARDYIVNIHCTRNQ